MPEPAQQYYEAAVKAEKERDALQEKLNNWLATEGAVVAKLNGKIKWLKAWNARLRRHIKHMEP